MRRWLFAAGFMLVVAGTITKTWSDDIAGGIFFLGLLSIAVGLAWWGIDKLHRKN